MKNLYLFFVVTMLLSCKGNNVSDMVIRECIIDVNKSRETLDISYLFANDLDIVPLETLEECLISDMMKTQFTNDYIYVSDRVAQCVFQFSSSGKFVKSIGRRGGGPTEYTSIGDFIANDNYVYIQDEYKDRILRYSINDNSVETYPLGDVWINEMIDFGDMLYCVSNYRNYEDGCFNLYKLDLLTRKIERMLPADAKIAENHSAWGLNRYSSKNGDNALLIYPLNDTIYTLKDGSVFPEMVVRFSDRTLPESMRYQDVMKTMETSAGYILGMDCIQSTDKYIFFEYGDEGLSKSVIINKETLDSETTNRFVLERWGNLYIADFEIHNNDFYAIQPAYIFKRSWNAIYSKATFENSEYRQAFEKLYNELADDDNPAIFKIRMK